MADRDLRDMIARCPGDGVAEIRARDMPPVPKMYDAESFTDLGSAHLEDDAMQLPEVRAETWAGYWFVNCDGSAPPMKDYLAPLPEHFADACAAPIRRLAVVARTASGAEGHELSGGAGFARVTLVRHGGTRARARTPAGTPASLRSTLR